MSGVCKRAKTASDVSVGDVPLRFAKLSTFAKEPKKGSIGAAGFDLFAAEEKSIAPGARMCVKTDIQIAVPPGSYGRIAPRSGLASRLSVDVGAGVVDSDYRGNVQVCAFCYTFFRNMCSVATSFV